MNKYKREKSVCKFNYKELYTECGDEPECYAESPPDPGCLIEPKEDYYKLDNEDLELIDSLYNEENISVVLQLWR